MWLQHQGVYVPPATENLSILSLTFRNIILDSGDQYIDPSSIQLNLIIC